MINILIADPQPIVVKGLKALFKSSKEVTILDYVTNTEDMFEYIDNNEVDLLILEMDISSINGVTAVRKIRESRPDIKILMFSAKSEDVYALSTIKAGAQGYISKFTSLHLIEEAVLKIGKGGMFISNELAQRLAFDEGTSKPRRFFRRLSTREVEVLKLIAEGKRNKIVAQELGLDEKTISTYKARIMRKLGVSNMVDLLQQAQALEIY